MAEAQSSFTIKNEDSANNAPIEIKTKADQSLDNIQSLSISSKKEQDQADSIIKRKKQVQQCAVKLFRQIKTGCKKDICFNTYCRRNPYCKYPTPLPHPSFPTGVDELNKFKDDKEILLHLTKMLFKTQDPESLVCSDTVSINAANIDNKTDKELLDAFDDAYQFCCSFVQPSALSSDPDSQCQIDFINLQKFYKRTMKHCQENNK